MSHDFCDYGENSRNSFQEKHTTEKKSLTDYTRQAKVFPILKYKRNIFDGVKSNAKYSREISKHSFYYLFPISN